jgi:RNA polymerase sigma-70 factor (ECF subfamily)
MYRTTSEVAYRPSRTGGVPGDVTLGPDFPTILAAARTGAPWAWELVYDDLSPIVLGYLRTRGAPDPEDALGEVFLSVVKGLSGFEGDERDLRAWVMTIAHRRLVDEFRRRERRPDEIPSERVPEHLAMGDAERDAMERLGNETVGRLLARLSPDQADVLLLRVLGDLTIDEVAAALGKRPGAVKALQRRALASLRRAISTEGVTL